MACAAIQQISTKKFTFAKFNIKQGTYQVVLSKTWFEYRASLRFDYILYILIYAQAGPRHTHFPALTILGQWTG